MAIYVRLANPLRPMLAAAMTIRYGLPMTPVTLAKFFARFRDDQVIGREIGSAFDSGAGQPEATRPARIAPAVQS